jgi:hypothetical protein
MEATQFTEYLAKKDDSRIVLLRNPEVVLWLLGDLSFLPEIEKKNKTADNLKYKVLEDKWGQEQQKRIRPDLDSRGQWTTVVGEQIGRELFLLVGKDVRKPANKNGYEPDLETNDELVEVKTQTFYTAGTAGEKILGVPFKYAEIPELYGKPLKILCIGGAERASRENYGNLPGPKCTPPKQKMLDAWRECGIEYMAASDILRSLTQSNSL